MKRIYLALAMMALALPAMVAQAQYNFTVNADSTLTISNYTGPSGAVTIPTTNSSGVLITGIAQGAFHNTGLTSVTIQTNITTIANVAFSDNLLVSVTIPSSVTNIGNAPFYTNTLLTNISVDTNNTYYGSSNGVLFGISGTNFVNLVEYPPALASSSYILPGTVTNVGNDAFYDCSNLVDITLNPGLLAIGANSFSKCSKLESVQFPSNFTALGVDSFSPCPALTNVCFQGNYSTNFNSSAFTLDPLQNIYYVGGATGWGSTYPLNDPAGGTPVYPCVQCGGVATAGDLQVYLSPSTVNSLGASWNVDGTTNQASGATAVNLTNGTYTLSFNSVSGWSSPANQTVTITNGEVTTVTGVYVKETQIGNLQVTITPAGAVSNGAMWQVNGGTPQVSGATVSNLSAGTHTVSFTTVSNWNTPANLNVTITNNETTSVTGVYATIGSPSGGLTVTLLPSAVVASNAQWQVDGGSNEPSGATVSNLSVGPHTISFSAVSNWNTPANQIVDISDDATNSATGTYIPVGTPSTGSLMVTLYPSSVIASNAQWQLDGGNGENSGVTVSNIPVGAHTISFAPITGWITPSNQDVTITTNALASTLGVYTQTNTLTNGLILQTNGSGTITLSKPLKSMVLGSAYKATAVPKTKNIFVSWVGGTNPPYTVLSTNAAYTFTNEPYLLLEANFETNIYLAAAGMYHGLFAPTNPAARTQTNSGSFALTVTSTGGATGSLDLGGQTVPLSGGKFNINGVMNLTTKASRLVPSFAVSLQLDFDNLSVSGTISNNDFMAEADGFRAYFSSTVKATNYEGQYTMVILGTNDSSNGPFGDSYGTVKVTSLGAVTLAGSLADGTLLSESGVISQDGYWPLYVNLYGGKGSLWGWTLFNNRGLGAALSWINATNTSKTAVYRTGFTNQAAAMVGYAYVTTNPLPTSLVATLEQTNPPFTISNIANVSAAGKITLTNAEDTNKLTLTLNKTTGVISGSFINPDNSKQTIKVNGVFLQGATNAAGYFLGTNQSGIFTLDPP